MHPTIACILPNYNYAKFFAPRLKEVLNQTYPVSELIVLDDASTDTSDEVIKSALAPLATSHPNLKVIYKRNKKNSGNVFSQWRKGIKLASADYVWIAELDDSASPTLLKTAMAPMIKNPAVVLSYVNSRLVGDVLFADVLRSSKDFVRRRHLPGSYVVDGKKEIEKNLAVFNSIPNVSAVVFRNLPALPEILEEAKSYRLSGDWYFYLSLAPLGSLAYSSKKLNSHRLSSASVTSTTTLAMRYEELQKIHRFAKTLIHLPASTLRRIAHSEASLKSRWGL